MKKLKLRSLIKEEIQKILEEYNGEPEYREGKGASSEEILSTIRHYRSMGGQIEWENGGEADFEDLANGELASIKAEYYPDWKKVDFKKVLKVLRS